MNLMIIFELLLGFNSAIEDSIIGVLICINDVISNTN